MRKEDNRNGGIAPPASTRESRLAWLATMADNVSPQMWGLDGEKNTLPDSPLFREGGIIPQVGVDVGPLCRPEPTAEPTPPEVLGDDLTQCFYVIK